MLKNLIAWKEPKSPSAEAFRTLRTNIQFSALDNELKVIVVTSSGPGEGKSTVMANLAITVAGSGKKVLLIDCDLRKPTVHKKLGIDNKFGITNILVGDKTLQEAIRNIEVPNLHIITSGPIPPNPAELIESNKMKKLIEGLKQEYDMILIDAPPVLAVTDAQILSTIADGTIFVTSYGQAEKFAVIKARELIDKVGGKILGVILNKIPEKGNSYYGSYYYGYES